MTKYEEDEWLVLYEQAQVQGHVEQAVRILEAHPVSLKNAAERKKEA